MGYKKMNQEISFADLILKDSMDKNRCLEHLININNSINWPNIKSILMSHYIVGTSPEGADAYPPLLLFKCLMLQKWFHIDSDPELESQINDRISFKKFLGLSFSDPSPDHSTFSRFRKRLSKEAMDQINSEILRQFENQGLTINEGVAIDARLVKSASRPISNKEIKKQQKKRNTSEGKLDKDGKPVKFSRDMESNWTVKNNEPHYGLKEHASVDVNHGFILSTTLTPASVNDSNFLPYCTLYSQHTKQPLKKVYADKGYFGKPNREFLSMNNIADGIMRKNTTTAKLTSYEKERNKKISKVRYIVEQYFGISHLHDEAYRARFTTIIKNRFDCWYRQAAYNISRGLKIMGTATI
ncbi:MAG: IS5 family transposase [Deltaproteobacteria bacterium]|nr:IS5 family transposase [Deltaproteobacteria bacterium]